MLIRADRMLHVDGALAPGWLQVEGERIVQVLGDLSAIGPPDVEVPVLSPGFVDIHCHGGGGGAFTSGDPAEIREAVRAHREEGTTSLVASLVSDELDALEAQIAALHSFVTAGELAGIHLEGPWLSPARCGAHDPARLADPAPAAVARLLTAGEGSVRMVTLAPELPGGIEAVRRLVRGGVVAAIGHTDAAAATIARAVDAGATVATHLFNAMPPVHHREPGPVPVLLGDDRVVVELIADGQHLHPDVLALAARGARGGWVLVTDAMAGALAPDGDYLLGPQRVNVRGGVARVEGGAVAGSTLSMSRAVRTAVAAGIPLAGALRAATAVPAHTVDLEGVGVLAAGAWADLVLLGEDLGVTGVLRRGRWVVEPAQ
ncbi:N-acetylglucosamine-6-phosphate deacetylase [Ornithinimicrobium cavernae]|uniref:N-acetylglucosamine-6-phosphate deacetylase n=1 Tax=Ornithinimicrobium cavernae TaxID=2666047 RepID=UPI000D685F52|nr:N-acetylglucosamine-6-phosphate deacetylase [Ornithinimicrobium cavernae]